jgi:hypothetical protein
VLLDEIETDNNLSLWSSYNTHKRIPKERPPNYGVVHTDLVLSFYSNALYAEYLSSKPNVELVAEFHNTLCAHCGQNWPSEWLGHATTHEDFPVPYAAFTSPLALAILHGLYYYAREALFDHHFMSDKERLGLLLYWACLEAQVAYSTIKFESHPYHIFANSLPRGLQIWSLLLENGANPNTRVALHYAGYVRRRRIEVEGSRSIEDEEMTVEERIEEDGTGSVIDEEVDAEERTAED